MFYTYVLKSQKDNKLYIGSACDLKKRIQQHTSGAVPSTKHRRPMMLLYYEAYQTEQLAREREQKLKQFGSAYKSLLQRLRI